MKNSSAASPEKTAPVWTILKLLNWTTSYFTSHEIEQPRATAEVLLAHCLSLARIDLYLRYDQPLHPDELARFKAAIRRRVKAEPVAYITGEKEFWSLRLLVNHHVLIPRPETECLVEAALALMPQGSAPPDASPPFKVLDMGTGSGAIVLALASERPNAAYYGLDRSVEATRVARMNAEQLGLAPQIHLFAGDWFSPVRPGVLFDLIVSNPPYVRRGEIPGLQPEIAQHEPTGALDGGETGLEDLSTILHRAIEHLVPGGYLLLEIGYDQRPGIEEILSDISGYEPPVFHRDYAGHNRVLQVRTQQ